MLFNSLHFVLFFPVVLVVYFLLPARRRWVWLLVCSYYFYMAWKPAYVLVIWLLTGVDYVAGLAIAGARNPTTRRAFLGLSLTSNLTLLFAFKYFNFASVTLGSLLGVAGVAYNPPFLDVAAPARHLVPHVPGAELHHRCLPGHARGGAAPRPIRALHRVLSAARRGAHRAGLASAAAAPRRARFPATTVPSPARSNRVGNVQEARRRRSARRLRQRRVRPADGHIPASSAWSRHMHSPIRSTATFRATPTSRSAQRECSAST